MSLRVWNASADAVLRHGMPLAFVAICVYSLPEFAVSVSLPEVFDLIGGLPIWAWFTAVCFAAASFYFVGHYDVLARRQLGLNGSETRTHRNGMIAVALSQVIGFGLITGSFARYRLRPEEGVVRAGQVTALVALLFLTGTFFVTAFATLVSGVLVDRTLGSIAFVCLAFCTLSLALLRPRVRVLSRQVTTPGLLAVAASVFWAAADILTAATAFYVLLPASVGSGFLAFLPVFCIALAAGIISGVPGGVGPFEVVLLGLTAPHMPTHIDQTCLLTAVCGFRVVYYVVPALVAALFVLRPTIATHEARPALPHVSPHHAPRAEVGVIAQNGGAMVALASGAGALWPAGNSLVSLFDPIVPAGSEWLRDFKQHARSRNMLPVMYKCSARHAVVARKEGWTVFKVAKDAILAPAKFELQGSQFSGLRRKLRKATKAGVIILPLRPDRMAHLGRIDQAWQERSGDARGGTMGRFCPSYIESQLVLVAEMNDKPIAFISLHIGREEWALDLMRDTPTAPDGTMYLLVHEAIKMAAAAQIQLLSLAAVPADCEAAQGVWTRSIAYFRGKWTAKGLYQFKSAFTPRWKPLYMATPGKIGFCIGAVDVLREVLRPGRMHSGTVCASDPEIEGSSAVLAKSSTFAPRVKP